MLPRIASFRAVRDIVGQLADKRHLVARLPAPFSLGRPRVADAGLSHPHHPAVIVDAVPDTPAGNDPELPLLELLPIDQSGTERSLRRVLAAVALTRLGADPLPCPPAVGPRGRAELFPAFDGVVRGEAEVPSTR